MQRLQGFQTDESMQRLIDELRAQGIEPDWARIPHRSIQAATTLITIGPVVLFYPFVQKYFVKGVMLGSVKGIDGSLTSLRNLTAPGPRTQPSSPVERERRGYHPR